jgi:hypothetical protein
MMFAAIGIIVIEAYTECPKKMYTHYNTEY